MATRKPRGPWWIALIVLCALVPVAVPLLAGWWRMERLALPTGQEIAATASARVGKEPLHVGDPIPYTIVVRARAPWRIGVPTAAKPGDGEKSYELKQIRVGRTQRIWGGVRRQFDHEARCFATGEITIGAGTVACTGAGGIKRTVPYDAVRLTIRSVLPAGALPQEPKEVKPPVGLPVNYWGLALGLLALAALVLLTLWLVRLARRERNRPALGAEQAVPREPPHVVAFRQLEELRRWEGTPEAYFVRLSECIRVYVRHRYGIRAPELTTEELLPILAVHAEVHAPARPLLRELALLWDMVKFARHLPPREIMNTAWDTAYQAVELTKEAEPARAGGAGAAAPPKDLDGGVAS